MTVTGVVVSTFIGATGLGVILPSPENDMEKTVFIEVEEIKSNRYTNADAERDWLAQGRRDAQQNLALVRLEEKLDAILAQIGESE